MEKYGVDLDNERVKTSDDKLKVEAKCTQCGAPLEATANVPKCPKCGTAPYEPKIP